MKHLQTILLIVLFTILCPSVVRAQDASVTVSVRRPLPLALSVWRTDPTVVRVQITALRDLPEFIIAFEVRNTTTGQSARSRNEHTCMPLFNMRMGETRIIDGTALICNNAVDASEELQRSLIAAGSLPEGDYTFCVELRDSHNRSTVLASSGHLCEDFNITWFEAPQVILPHNTFDLSCTSAINFSWSGVTPLPVGLMPQYRLRVVGVIEGQEPRTALEAATASEIIVDEYLPTTNYTLLPNNPRLLDLANRRAPRIIQFAWQVQALDERRNPLPTRGGSFGKSDIGLFGVSCSSEPPTPSCTQPLSLNAFFPAEGDTLPWLPPHLIVQWAPYCSTLRSMDYTLSVTEISGSTLPENSRLLRWSAGPIESQSLSGVENAQERSQLIITNWRSGSGGIPALNAQLRRGSSYRWSVQANFERLESGRMRSYSANTTPRSYTPGLRMPQNPNPANNATLTDGSDIDLQWDIPAPAQLMFPYPDLGTRRASSDRMEFGSAQEYVRVRVSRTADMSSPIAAQSTPYPRSGNYTTGESSISEIFGHKSFENLNLAPGTYYWQVQYCDPLDTNRIYRQGPVWSFVVGGTTIEARECVRITPYAPESAGTISGDANVHFSVSVNPLININAIRGGRLRVWRMNSATEEAATVKARNPEVDASFTGHDAANIALGSGPNAARSYLDLNVVNGSASSTHRFQARDNTVYLWTFSLQFDGATLRRDNTRCDLSEVSTNDAVFTFRNNNACSDPCTKPAPTNRTPSTRSFQAGDELSIGHFQARLTTVSGTGASLSGEAVVSIPIFRGGMSVTFNAIQVNDANEVYGGEMKGKVADASPIDPTLANALEGALNLTPTQVQAVHDLASDASRLVSGLTGLSPMTLPIGFDRVIEGQRIVVGVMGMVFRPTDARFNAVLSFPMPALGPRERIGFGVRNICFHPNGFGRDIDIYLADDLGYTPNDESWSFHFLSPRAATAGAAADSGTFARFDCSGFSMIRLKAEVNFPRTWMLHSPDDGQHVKAQFTTVIRKGGDFIAEATMEQFSPAGTPEFVMQCDTLAIDFSNLDNPRSIQFPENYTGDKTLAWRGFYMNRLMFRLPEQLRTFDASRPPQFEVRNLLIDRSGFTAKFRLNNVFMYPQGNFGEWGGSLDTIGVDFVSSSLSQGYLKGRIKTPISDDPIAYSATLSNARDSSGSTGLQFVFNVQPTGELNMDMWVARLTLLPTSYIRLTANASGFRAMASFSGSINIGGMVGDVPGVSLNHIQFQDLQVMSYEPYVRNTSQFFGFASPQHAIASTYESPEAPPDGSSDGGSGGGSSGNSGNSAGGFNLSINDIQIVGGVRPSGMPGIGLRFTLSINLQSGSNGISGGTTLSIWSKLIMGDGPMRIAFDGVDLDSIGIGADMGAVTIAGGVRFYRQDPVYGTGFKGGVRANFCKMVDVSATVQFGSVRDFRYWFVDAKVIIASGIPIMTGVGIYGFGGGAWYNMVRRSIPPEQEAAMMAPQHTSSTDTSANSSSAPPGSTNTGFSYEPYYDPAGTTFGCYALVTLGTYSKPDAFNLDVRLVVQFAGGGINNIALEGDGYMMADLFSRNQAPVIMHAVIDYNFPRKTLNGMFDIVIKYPVDSPLLTGHGRMVMHFSPETWFVKIGDPTGEKVHVEFLNFATIQMYIMAGLNLPNVIQIPNEITEVLGPLPAMRSPSIANADGFATGAMLDINPPEMRFLIFYGSFRFLMGFDMNLLNYGTTARCASGSGASRALGMNGWYALGQFYARIEASIGLFVDLGFIQGQFEILGLRCCAALQGGLPNPSWYNGKIQASYNILGGLIQGNCRFDFSVGEGCTPLAENPLLRTGIIADLQPANGSTNVPIDVEPQCLLNYALETPFDLVASTRADGSKEIRTFRVKMREFSLRRSDGTGPLFTAWSKSANDASHLRLTPELLLNSLSSYTARVAAYGEELKNSKWEAARNNDNALIPDEVVTSTFSTGPIPDTIRPEDVFVSYPRNRHRYYLQGECNQGYIQLFTSYDSLFTQPAPAGYRYLYKVRFISLPSNQRIETDAQYSNAPAPLASGATYNYNRRASQITFTVPPLQNNTLYALQVIRRQEAIEDSRLRPISTDAIDRARASAVFTTTLYERMGVTVNSAQRRLSGLDVGRRVTSNEKLYFAYFFKTSSVNTLREKTSDWTRRPAFMPPAFANFTYLESYIAGRELVDEIDIIPEEIIRQGSVYAIPPIMRFTAPYRSGVWYTNFTEPWIYRSNAWLDTIFGAERRFRLEFPRHDVANPHWAETPFGPTERSLQVAEISNAGQDALPSTDSRIRNVMNSVNAIRTGNIVSSTPGRTAAMLCIQQNHPLIIPWDFLRLKQRATALYAAWCCGETLTPEEWQRLRDIIAKEYELPVRGIYPFELQYLDTRCDPPDGGGGSHRYLMPITY